MSLRFAQLHYICNTLHYTGDMSATVNVRLPEHMVEFLDGLVRRGIVPNRTAAISAAIEREIRARQAMSDVEALQQHGPQDDLDELVAWSTDRAVIQD